MSLLLIFKIIFTFVYFYGCLYYILKSRIRVFDIITPKIYCKILYLMQIVHGWSLFTGHGNVFKEVLIRATTDKDEYKWNLRYSKEIGDIKFQRIMPGQTLAQCYPDWNEWLSPYFYNEINKYFVKRGEKLIYFEIVYVGRSIMETSEGPKNCAIHINKYFKRENI